MIKITAKPIDVNKVMETASSLGAGAVNVFIGTVRDHAHNKRVVWLEYEAYEAMAVAEIKKIIDLLATDLLKCLADRHIQIELTDEAKNFIAEQGYDPVFGARPLKRFLQRELETPLAKALLKGEVSEGDKVTVHLKGDKLVFKNGKEPLKV